MEKLSDIIGSIRERAANPFFVSFILSWLVVNWEIPVALFWPDLSQMQTLGYKTIFDYIQFILSKPDSFWLPVGLATGYTILSPVIWNGLRWFNAWAIKWGNKIVFDMSKESNVSTEKYLELRENLKKNSDTISEMINTESKRIQAHDETKKMLADAQEKFAVTELDHQAQIKAVELARQQAVLQKENEIKNLTEIQKKERDKQKEYRALISGLWRVEYKNGEEKFIDFVSEAEFLIGSLEARRVTKSGRVVNHLITIGSLRNYETWFIVASPDNFKNNKIYYYLTNADFEPDIWIGFENEKEVKSFTKVIG